MPNKKNMFSSITLTALTFIFALSSSVAFGFDRLIENQLSIVAQAGQQENPVNYTDQNSENKAYLNKTGMSKNISSGMMGHMSSRSGHHGGGHSYAHIIVTHADELNLSDAQLGRIVRLHMKHAQEHKQFKKNIRKSMMHFHHASMNPGTDDDSLRKLGNDHVDAFNAMLEQHIRGRNVVNAILSAEQRKQLKTMKMNHAINDRGHGAHKSHKGYGKKYNQRYY